MTVPGIISGSSEVTSSPRERKIIVANTLPLQSKRDSETGKWSFSWDEDSLQLQLKDGFPPDTEFLYVGSLNAHVEPNEQEAVSQTLLTSFNSVATFLPKDLQEMYYRGFCKHQLWPLFHYMLPMFPDHGDRFDRKLWQAYVSANKIFSDRVMEVINPEDDYVWIQDYHLMVLPTFLRKRFNRIKLGFFLHSPFPSSEIYRTLPVRDEILRGLLNCADDSLLKLTRRAQGRLRCLNLGGCVGITDDGLMQVLASNPRLSKLSVSGCHRLSTVGLLSTLRDLRSSNQLGVKSLVTGGALYFTREQFNELNLLLGADGEAGSKSRRRRLYTSCRSDFSLDDDRGTDLEICPWCEKPSLVFDCASETCPLKDHPCPKQSCRACVVCIERCHDCGSCLNDCEHKPFCFAFSCVICYKKRSNQLQELL